MKRRILVVFSDFIFENSVFRDKLLPSVANGVLRTQSSETVIFSWTEADRDYSGRDLKGNDILERPCTIAWRLRILNINSSLSFPRSSIRMERLIGKRGNCLQRQKITRQMLSHSEGTEHYRGRRTS